MKMVTIPPQQATEINGLLAQARDEDVLVQTADGTEFVGAVVDEFDREIARTCQNLELMAILDERAAQANTFSLDEVKRQFGLGKSGA